MTEISTLPVMQWGVWSGVVLGGRVDNYVSGGGCCCACGCGGHYGGNNVDGGVGGGSNGVSSSGFTKDYKGRTGSNNLLESNEVVPVSAHYTYTTSQCECMTNTKAPLHPLLPSVEVDRKSE